MKVDKGGYGNENGFLIKQYIIITRTIYLLLASRDREYNNYLVNSELVNQQRRKTIIQNKISNH